MRSKIKNLIGVKLYYTLTGPLSYFRALKDLYINFSVDRKLYMKHSNVFNLGNFKKKEANIILYYHSIEKGFLFEKPRPRFAKDKIIRLHKLLNDVEIIKNIGLSQIQIGYSVVCKYYELHQDMNVDIESYFSQKDYLKYKGILSKFYNVDFEGVKDFHKNDFYEDTHSDFFKFSYSRKSVRNFTGEIVSESKIKDAVKLSLNSPSVCNRQSVKVYLLQDRSKIDRLLKLQGGFKGYSDNVSQLLILTADRNYFYTIGERNQFYIDGGIFLMNLLYSLHYYKIASCPANWGKTVKDDRLARDIFSIEESEKIICLIPIGEAVADIRVCLSERRKLDEVFKSV